MNQPSADLITLLNRYNEACLSEPADTRRTWHLVESLESRGTWPSINYGDVSLTGFEHTMHLENMIELARSYRGKVENGKARQHVRDALVASLNYWLAHDFIAENWWHNEIGTPQKLARTLLLLDDELSEEQRCAGLAVVSRANLQGFGARPGGDLVQIAEIMAQAGILARDCGRVETATTVMAEEIRVTTERGIQPDFSFHHRRDGVIQTTAYGDRYINSIARFAAHARGTVFSLPADRLALAIDYVLEGIRWTLAYGTWLSPASMNRDFSRPAAVTGMGVRPLEYLMLASSHRREELLEVMRVRQSRGLSSWSGNRVFWRSTVVVHQRPTCHVSVRMYSTRNHSTEGTYNGEGLKNHHLADGSCFVTRTGEEYHDVAAAWDWQKIPGTTILQKATFPSPDQVKKRGLTEFVGGVSDGSYGLAAMDFRSPHDSVSARKTWFFFDDEFVALGAGITADGSGAVVTTLNQCRLRRDVVAAAAGTSHILDEGAHQLSSVEWVHHDGVAYVFPQPADVQIANGRVRGSWCSINQQRCTPLEAVDVPIFKLWLDHGEQPHARTYAYIVAPIRDADAVTSYREHTNIRILANRPDVQAVRHTGLQLVQIAFYAPGALSLGGKTAVRADSPCLMLVFMSGDLVVRMAVSDPTQRLQRLSVTLFTSPDEAEASTDSVVRTTLSFDLPRGGHAGRSVIREFGREDATGATGTAPAAVR